MALMPGNTSKLHPHEGIYINTAFAFCWNSNLRAVVAKSATGFDDPISIYVQLRTSRRLCLWEGHGGCAWETLGSAG